MGCVKSPQSFILFLLNSDIKFDSLDYLNLIDRRTVPVPCPCVIQFTTDVFSGACTKMEKKEEVKQAETEKERWI